ncbi:hypothetical protein GSI_13275 [Ganoderma sinense ZZ0214-1]|uniref:glutathione transferase n=1 Tax=Ganoderma sinense ZZ0214-1 TaxID=1077348 RepID=A0A2G8RV43_9APHY|nr:hypothetical protein GSI_13275 [Ganoderma sinense ZZ0214-1]
MVLKIYGHLVAPCTQRVLAVAEELGVPYELVVVDYTKNEHKTLEYLAHQPFGQVPYIEDDGVEVFESRAICRFLALKYGGVGTLLPAQSDLEGTARFEQAASVELNDFEAPMGLLAWELRYKEYYGLKADLEVAKEHRTKAESRLDGYEAMLSKTRFLAGDELTLADLFHLPYESLVTEQEFDFVKPESSRWPNVARYKLPIYARLQ